MVSTLNSLGDTYLVLPLSWGNFGINTGDAKSCVQEASKGSFNNGSSKSVFVSNGTVISSLLVRETSFRPS